MEVIISTVSFELKDLSHLHKLPVRKQVVSWWPWYNV